MRRRALFHALSVVLLAASVASFADAAPARLDGQLPDGFWERARGLFPDRPKQSQLDALQFRKAPSRLDVLVVGCDFSDSLMWGRDLEDFPGWPEQRRRGNLIPGTDIPEFAAHDSTFFDAQMRKVADYFHTVSFGALTIDWDVHGTIVNLPRPMGYYGDTDSSDVRVVEMTQEVLDAIDADVDFSLYDTVVVIHAGAGQETDVLGDSPEQIFSNYLDIRDFEDAAEAGLLPEASLATDEGPVEHVLILPESESQDSVPEAGFAGFFGTRGVYCFEFGLRLGMLNLGDFTPENPDSQGIGNFGLMGFGLFTGLGIVPSAPSAFNRWLMGWVAAVEVQDDATVRLGAINETGAAVSDTLLVKVPINDREYWLVEYRLQDPDGDLFFSFDDLNQNNLPDFFDADSEFANGWPTSSFDPDTDTLESTEGAEWDWFMSENPARSADRCQRAGGSGLYIWHIDERIIRDAIESGTTTVNSDRDRRGVDVEEADGIQDLDSPRPSPYFLGWDGDAWRAPTAGFGPDTNPSTDTADGESTGVRIHAISDPVVEQFPRNEDGECTGYVYAPAMTFQVTFGDPGSEAPAVRALVADPAPLGDIRAVDLGTQPGQPAPDGTAELVMAGDDGTVFAWRGGLTEWIVASGGVLATAVDGAEPVTWNGPPAVGDLDGDGTLEVVVSSPDAVHIFSSADGTELLDGDADAATTGVAWRPAAGSLAGPPILVGGGPAADESPLEVLQVVNEEDGADVVRLRWDGTSLTSEVERDSNQGFSAGTTGPSLVGGSEQGFGLAYPVSDSTGHGVSIGKRGAGTHVVRILDAPADDEPVLGFSFSPRQDLEIAAWDSTGVLHLLDGDVDNGTQDVAGYRLPQGPRSALVGGPERTGGLPVLAAAAGDALLALDRNLAPLDGFPYRPGFLGETFRAAPRTAAPLLADVTGDGRVEILWADAVGRIHAVGLDARPLTGWPRLGPAEPAGSMAVADVDGDGQLELVAAGRFEGIETADIPNRTIASRPRGEVVVFDLEAPVDAWAPWPQGRGGPLQSSFQPDEARTAGRGGGGSALAEDSLWIGPNPARGVEVRVRARMLRDATARVTLYTLEGELVADSGPVAVAGGGSLDEPLEIEGLVSGYYLCRVEADGDVLVGTFTVVK